jgi:hypothetical protein
MPTVMQRSVAAEWRGISRAAALECADLTARPVSQVCDFCIMEAHGQEANHREHGEGYSRPYSKRAGPEGPARLASQAC